MQYGLYEFRKNVMSLIKTKLFFKNARLIRYPVFIRNKKNIIFSKGFTCGYNCRIESIVDEKYSGKIIFGENVKIGDYVHISAADLIEIGDNTLMASHIFISDLDHGSYSGDICDNPLSIPDHRMLKTSKVKIGKNVWVGENVTILKGVTIGDGSIIGACSLINKDVPNNSMVVGNPMRIIKYYDEKEKKWKKKL